MTALDPRLSALYAKRPQVIKPGLARIEAALACLGADTLLAAPAVLIGGTNGKGTTTGFLWRLLAALGVKTGLFTSPHLVSFAERIQTSHAPVDVDLLLAELASLERQLPAEVYEALSFFEVSTLLGLRVFRRLGVEVDLLEVGLGGRWDSTNVARPCLSVIASIGLDHMELLGPTTAAIAAEKAGIMRPATPVLWGGPGAGDGAAVAVLTREAERLGAPFWELGRDFGAADGRAWASLPGAAVVRAPLPRAWSGWPGFLRDNWLKAFAALVHLAGAPALAGVRARLQLGTPEATVRRAIAVVDSGAVPVPPCMRGRFDRVAARDAEGQERSLLLDVCHNVDGARALVRGLVETGLVAAAGGQLAGLVSILADKDCDAVLDVLRPVLRPLALFASGSERSWTRARLAPRHLDLPFHPSFAAALAATPGGAGPTVVCGSVYAVGEVCGALGLLAATGNPSP